MKGVMNVVQDQMGSHNWNKGVKRIQFDHYYYWYVYAQRNSVQNIFIYLCDVIFII